MKFYKMLAEYYDEIFPLNKNLVSMIKELTPEGGRILDVGCATGALVEELANCGYDAEGLEYVPELIKHKGKITVGDMHNLPFGDSEFDVLVCTGNTLAHVSGLKDAEQVLKEFSRVMKKDGRVIIQILNYDMILRNRPASLPVIQTERVTFERFYEYEEGCIKFSGVLKLCENNVNSSVSLYPLTNSELDKVAYLSGLRPETLLGSFDGTPFDAQASLPLEKILCTFN